MSTLKQNQITDVETADSDWSSLYKVGGAAALLIVLPGLIEIIITFLPGGYTFSETVSDWFTLFQNNVALIFAMSGGILTIAWHILITRRLFQLGQGVWKEEANQIGGIS